MPSEQSKAYLVWSNEHQAWWRPNERGYTTNLSAAGVYSHREALLICATARDGWSPNKPPPEIPVVKDDAERCLAAAGVVDVG
jgi:hypothetical protein